MRRYSCPIPDYKEAWIELPDTWLGKHAQARDTALRVLPENTGKTVTNFAVSMALLDDWNIPGLTGNPDKWDFEALDLKVITWVTSIVIPDFLACFIIPKASPAPSGTQDGEKRAAKAG